ncbi:MAG TPA: cupin domain-containing protein [Thermoanaerobaculia bacterium]|jgi:mannose-6-phosphate isomerase-like protein (cupin superfamily)|nr:cupin domain-containing protein [Thermoanaerobaculia bacterium]
MDPTPPRPKKATFDLTEVAARRASTGDRWLEFFRTTTLRTGLYVLKVAEVDPQKPHTEDEIYYVIDGRAVLDVDGEDHPVEPGSILYVQAGVPHHFHSISEELSLLVFFASGKG